MINGIYRKGAKYIFYYSNFIFNLYTVIIYIFTPLSLKILNVGLFFILLFKRCCTYLISLVTIARCDAKEQAED